MVARQHYSHADWMLFAMAECVVVHVLICAIVVVHFPTSVVCSLDFVVRLVQRSLTLVAVRITVERVIVGRHATPNICRRPDKLT